MIAWVRRSRAQRSADQACAGVHELKASEKIALTSGRARGVPQRRTEESHVQTECTYVPCLREA